MDKEFLIFLGSILLVLGIILGLSFCIEYIIDKYVVTPRFGVSIQKPVKYDFWAGGCFIKMDNGQWIQCTHYQGVNLNK